MPPKRSENSEANPFEEAGSPGLDPKVQQKLGEMFQSFCEEMIKQPVPDKFLDLLEQLEAKERPRNER